MALSREQFLIASDMLIRSGAYMSDSEVAQSREKEIVHFSQALPHWKNEAAYLTMSV
jgi:hypothetical protein